LQAQVTGTTGKTVAVYLYSSTGVDISPISVTTVVANSANVALTSGTFSTITVTATIPSNVRTLKVGVISGDTFANTEHVIFGNVQLELGSVATPFSRAGGTFGGEQALCQRYYYRAIAGTFNINFGMGQCFSTTGAYAIVPFPVTMRTQPTALEQNGTAGDYRVITSNFGATNCTSIVTFNSASNWQSTVVATVGSGLVAGNATAIASTNGGAFLGWSAEL
jgi:hypothetical protein